MTSIVKLALVFACGKDMMRVRESVHIFSFGDVKLKKINKFSNK